jgi:hypothetical protein
MKKSEAESALPLLQREERNAKPNDGFNPFDYSSDPDRCADDCIRFADRREELVWREGRWQLQEDSWYEQGAAEHDRMVADEEERSVADLGDPFETGEQGGADDRGVRVTVYTRQGYDGVTAIQKELGEAGFESGITVGGLTVSGSWDRFEDFAAIIGGHEASYWRWI